MEQESSLGADVGHIFPLFGSTSVPFVVANQEHAVHIGKSCVGLLEAWEDENVVADSDMVKPADSEWYTVNSEGALRIDSAKSNLVTNQVLTILTDRCKALLEIHAGILEDTVTSKFIPFEDVLELVVKHGFSTTEAMAATIAVFLRNPRLKFFNNGVVLNKDGDVFVLDEKTGWTEASVILLALAGITSAPSQERAQKASQFSYGPPRGCNYRGRADRAAVEGVPVTSQQQSNLQKYGIGGDGRYSDRRYLFFRTEMGKWRKVYLEGNLMFVSGMRGRSIVSKVPVKALEVMGVGIELSEGHKGLEVPTNAMFDVVVRSINAGNERLSMWFTPKVLRGEIVCCKGPRTMTCFFRSEVDLDDVEFGPTIRACILQSGQELGYVVNVGTESYLLAHPYDSHGFIIRNVGQDAYHTKYGEVPTRDRYLVEDASRMFFGGINGC